MTGLLVLFTSLLASSAGLRCAAQQVQPVVAVRYHFGDDPDGKLTVANAGHLPPYRNGEELPIDGGLPLGISPDTVYAETTLQLSPGDRLTFLSDGVVEARNTTGELFGFERTRECSHQSAEEIASAAQQFGQEDDITVLTVTRAPRLEAVTV